MDFVLDLPPAPRDRSVGGGNALGTATRKQQARLDAVDEAELLALLPRIIEFIATQSGTYRVN